MSRFFLSLPPSWTAIAARPRQCKTGELLWHALDAAPLHFDDARRLAAKGIIIMAQRHYPDRVELLVRPATDIPPA
ncbi:MAG: hypothetical protein ACJ8AW_45105 [Rhodopila sp.]